MKERILSSLITVIVCTGLQAQNIPAAVPRLVVGITIDQLRSDYIEAFTALYGERGFKRLLKEGRVYYNAEYDFINPDPSSAVAAIYTGGNPYTNGVVADYWMDRNTLRVIKSTDDPAFMGIYTSENTSPKHLSVSTLADELMVATQGQAITYSIAPTREMAVFAAGHASKGAFWINDHNGKWCGTTYYGDFPQWATYFNDHQGLDFRIADIVWEPSLPVTSYKYVTSDVKQLNFRHKFDDQRGEKYRCLKTSPVANDEVNKLVNACLNASFMGQDDIPDLLSIGYYAGNYNHASSVQCPMEIQDVYARLDNTLGDLLDIIDKKVGLANTLFFITSTGYADPEPADPPQYKIPGGEFYIKRCAALLNMYLMAIYGQGQYVDTYFDNQIYLNRKLIEERKLNLTEILNRSSDFLVQFSGVKEAYSSQRLLLGAWNPKIEKIRNSYNPLCSGDLMVEVLPGWTVVRDYTNDVKVVRSAYASVPLFFFGNNIRPAKIYDPVQIGAIIPTMAHFMRIRAPNASTLPPLTEIRH